MHLRPITRADLPSCATIYAAAFLDDELISYLAPRQREYPLAFRTHMLRRLKMLYTQQGMHGFVCVSDSADGESSSAAATPAEEVVMGYAFWEVGGGNGNGNGSGHDATAAKWRKHNSSLGAKLEALLLAAEDKYAQVMHLDRAHSAARAAAFRAAVGHEKPWARMPAYWHLQSLVVGPQWGRRGVGGCLLGWGMERAREEGVVVALESSVVGRGLYAKMGFKVVDWLGERLREGEGFRGGAAMVWDAEGRWTREVARREVVIRGGREVEVEWIEDLQRVNVAALEMPVQDAVVVP